MLDAVTRKSAANHSRNRSQNATASSAHLISQQATGDSSAHGSETRCRFGFLNGIDGNHFAGIRVDGDRSWRGLSRVLIGIVVRIPRSLSDRRATVMMDAWLR
jgi:hypothetical protein